MDTNFTPAESGWRQEVTTFLEKEMSWDFLRQIEEEKYSTAPCNLPFSKKLADRGWIALWWPKKYGGSERSYIDQTIFDEQIGYYWAPTGAHTVGLMAGSTILAHGTEEQKKRFLPPIARQEMSYCNAHTEPQAGTDLASLTTRAVADGSDYIINGQKIYSSAAHHADLMWLCARTDPKAPKHRGISMFVVDIKTPGVTVAPLWTVNHGRVNIIYLDDVRVPGENLVGEKNQGWNLLRTTLTVHRIGMAHITAKKRMFDELVTYARETKRGGRRIIEDPVMKYRFAEFAIHLEVSRMLAWRLACALNAGEEGYQTLSTVPSLFDRDSDHRFWNFAMDVLGFYGQLQRTSKYAVLLGKVERHYRTACCVTGGGAVPDISRNTIAHRRLGLPVERVVVS